MNNRKKNDEHIWMMNPNLQMSLHQLNPTHQVKRLNAASKECDLPSQQNMSFRGVKMKYVIYKGRILKKN